MFVLKRLNYEEVTEFCLFPIDEIKIFYRKIEVVHYGSENVKFESKLNNMEKKIRDAVWLCW